MGLDDSGQAGAIEITPAMTAAGVRVMRESGMLEHDGLVDDFLIGEVLREALAAREVFVHSDC